MGRWSQIFRYLIPPSLKIAFLGYWKNNKREGIGTFRFHNEDVYEGDWKNGKSNGYGLYTHKNGRTYEG